MYSAVVAEIAHGLLIAVFAFLFVEVLTRNGEILGWWPALIQRITGANTRPMSDWNWKDKLLFAWLYGCAKCMSGALSVLSLIWWPALTVEGFAWRILTALFLAYWLTQRNETGRL